MNQEDAAELAGLSRATIGKAKAAGDLPFRNSEFGLRMVLFQEEDVLAWAESWKAARSAPKGARPPRKQKSRGLGEDRREGEIGPAEIDRKYGLRPAQIQRGIERGIVSPPRMTEHGRIRKMYKESEIKALKEAPPPQGSKREKKVADPESRARHEEIGRAKTIRYDGVLGHLERPWPAPGHSHHYVISPPNGETSWGRCACGSWKEFCNAFSDAKTFNV